MILSADQNEARSPVAPGKYQMPNWKAGRRFLRAGCWLAALTLGAAEAWVARFTMFPDGVSYLDIGDAYWRRDWHNAINAYWSPLYSWILGFFLKVLKPQASWEYPLVHVVNFLIYVLALFCFDYFFETFIAQEDQGWVLKTQSQIWLPLWAWYLVGYSAFMASSLFLITISFVSGDMALAAIFYLGFAMLLNIRNGRANWTTFVILGLVLGIGYLTKTAMFLISVPFFLTAAAAQRSLRRSLKPVAVSFLVFLAITSPFILLLSKVKGRPTFGDSGKINYLVNVNKVQFFIPHELDAKHPVRKLVVLPEAYEYSHPISGTYPLWYDPSYWHEGIQPHFELRRQLRTVALSLAECSWISFNVFMGLHISTAVLFLYLLAPKPAGCVERALSHWVLWIPAACGIALYALVAIESRYVGALFCMLWILGFAGVRLPNSPPSRRIITGTVLAVALATCAIATRDVRRGLRGTGIAERHIATPVCSQVAAALNHEGVKPGDKLAIVSDWLFPSREGAYISRLARVQIVGEARPEEFWAADASTRARVAAEFDKVGAKVMLAYHPPRTDPGWQRIADTDYYFYRLRP